MDDLGLDDFDSAPAPRLNGHGGARPGAGRPKGSGGLKKSQASKDFDTAKARNEAAKAQLNELEYQVKSGQYVAREAVRQGAATVIQSFVQTVRSVADGLERRGVPVDVCVAVDEVLTEAMTALSYELEMMSNPAPVQ